MDNRRCCQHDPLVVEGDIILIFRYNFTHLPKFVRDFRREVVVIVLSCLPARDIRFYTHGQLLQHLTGFLCVHRLNVDG